MKTEFMTAINQLSSERHLPKEVILEALEAALVSAYKKEVFTEEQDIAVRIDSFSGEIHAYLIKTVVEDVTSEPNDISLDDARKMRRDVAVGDTVEIEATPQGAKAGRIAAQIARQVVLQRLREAEHHATFEQFVGKEGEVVTGTVQFAQPNAVYVNIGRREAILPASEQLPSERYHQGQQLRFYLLQTIQEGRNARVMLSRSHPNLVRRLFEIEIPEVHSGIVEVRSVARDPGQRSKVAVSSRQESVEPIGSCLGPRGIRLQSIVNHLNGEKVDVVEWDPDPRVFIANALSPAQVAHISMDEDARTAMVVVPDKQLSLAIGRGGQNARLAAKLTGWRIDIKSSSAAEAEMGEARAAEAVTATPDTTDTVKTAPEASAPHHEVETSAAATSDAVPGEKTTPDVHDVEETTDAGGETTDTETADTEVTEKQPEEETLEQLLASEVFRFEEDSGKDSLSALRFAEDILPGGRRGGKNDRGKKKKRRTYSEDVDDTP